MGPVLVELEARCRARRRPPPHEDSFARGALRDLAALQRSATLRRLGLDLISPRLARRASALPMPGLAAGVAPSEAEHDGVAGDEGGRVTLTAWATRSPCCPRRRSRRS